MRVEVSRLRKLLGPWIDTDRYRLTCDVETDVRRVEGLLRAGAVREAAEAYPGPLLPDSEAPGSSTRASSSTRWLRQAVMTSDDPDALWAWVHAPTGRDDIGAWKRLLAPLEFRDPRRSLCAARRRASCAARSAGAGTRNARGARRCAAGTRPATRRDGQPCRRGAADVG